MAKRDDISPGMIRQLFDYNPDTGVLTWKTRTPDMFRTANRAPETMCATWNSRYAGKEAGAFKEGRLKVSIYRKMHFVHRVAWCWMTGSWPAVEVDHKSLDALDNSWKNLRLATSSQNKCNRRTRKDSASGYKCIYYNKKLKKYRVMLNVMGRTVYCKFFNTLEEARAAYCEAAVKYHGEFARTE